MTQAPTPGPLSGNDVNRECKACGAFKAERNASCTFCGLAPTAPVEASGSEREDEDAIEVEDMEWPESPLANDLYQHIQSQFCLHPDEAAEETGEVLSILAQHGVDPMKLPARAEAQDEDTPCTDCGDTGVTHQTERRCSCQEAEAQDEGAAGIQWSVHVRGPDEIVAAGSYEDAVSYSDKLNQECPDANAVPMISPHQPVALSASDRACYEYPGEGQADLRAAFVAGACFIAAHPSPTPAADKDRVRIAVEALEPFAAHPDFHAGDDWPVTFVNDEERVPGVTAGDFRRAAKALAALKSEGK